MNDLLSWAHLGSVAGVSVAVVALTQILKHYVPKRLGPKWVALILALVLTYAGQLVAGDFAPESFLLSALNAVLSAGASIGAYEAFVEPIAHSEHVERS